MDESTHPFSDKVLDRAFTLEFWDVDLTSFFTNREREGKRRQHVAEQILEQLHALLAPIRRHFGYRTAGEVLDFIEAMQSSEDHAIDLAVFAKVLPRIRGEQTTALDSALQGIQSLCQEHGLTRSRAKVQSMLDRLQHTGITKFWE